MATSTTSTPVKSPVLQALLKRKIVASVSECDHYRVHGVAVETDYIISVRLSTNAESQPSSTSKDKNIYFDPYMTSKTFSSFRTLSNELEDIVKSFTKQSKADDNTWDSLSPSVKSSIQLSDDVHRLVHSQKTQYLGKVNFIYVQSLAKQRTRIITDILDIVTKFPPSVLDEDDRCLMEMVRAVEHFFLTDICVEEEGAEGASATSSGISIPSLLLKTPLKKKKRSIIEGTPAGATPAVVPSVEVPTFSPSPSKMQSPVVPVSCKVRRSIGARSEDNEFLNSVGEEAAFVIDHEGEEVHQQKKQRSGSSSTAKRSFSDVILDKLENDPAVFFIVSSMGVLLLRVMSNITFTIDTDVAMLMVFGSYCLGSHGPCLQHEIMGTIEKAAATARLGRHSSKKKKKRGSSVGFVLPLDHHKSSRMALKKAMSVKTILSPTGEKATFETIQDDSEGFENEVDEEGPLIKSPLPLFPDGTELGSEYNCWSSPLHENFQVRGPNYLTDKKKVSSAGYLFAPRGVDLFLTDLCPENVGSNSGIMGGQLRDEHTFIVNLRLPWGVLLLYSAIPERFMPFLKKRYNPAFDDSQLPSLDTMTPADRTIARFFLADDATRSKSLKLIPTVVQGPWIVKSVVGGKPAIIGKKLPAGYVYQPPVKNKAAYFEVDLDVAASSAARRVLSVARSATTELTVDIGFVIQGNLEDELPEQMLFAARLHGLDPLSCPNLPPMKNIIIEMDDNDDED